MKQSSAAQTASYPVDIVHSFSAIKRIDRRNDHLPQPSVDIKIPGAAPPLLHMPSQLDT